MTPDKKLTALEAVLDYVLDYDDKRSLITELNLALRDCDQWPVKRAQGPNKLFRALTGHDHHEFIQAHGKNRTDGLEVISSRAGYWIECAECPHEIRMVEIVPSTGKPPTTPDEVWSAAQAVGWTGTPLKMLCPSCSKKK